MEIYLLTATTLGDGTATLPTYIIQKPAFQRLLKQIQQWEMEGMAMKIADEQDFPDPAEDWKGKGQ